jgi:hypothetical protein
MVSALDDSLRAWLRKELSRTGGADVSFRTPDDAWAAAATRPAVNLFLHEVTPGTGPRGQLAPFTNAAGATMRTPPAPRASFAYLVSAWADDVHAEHRLFGDVLRLLADATRLPDEHLAPALVRPVDLALGDSSVARTKDVWDGLGGRLRPSLVLVATMILPAGGARPLEPAVTSVEGGVARVPATAPAHAARRPAGHPHDGHPHDGHPAAAGGHTAAATTGGRRGPWLGRLRRGDRVAAEPIVPPAQRSEADGR